MISEQRQRIREILGEQNSEDIRLIIRKVVIETWEVPHLRFSPLMIEHLLFFIAKTLPILNSRLFPDLLSRKFLEEYGYGEFPTVVPRLVDDLVQSLRVFCNERYPLMKVSPRRAIEKVFRPLIVLYLEGCPIDNRTEESIRQISGLPFSFLNHILDAFVDLQNGLPLPEDLAVDFKEFFSIFLADLTL